ncbi:hypothetical protein [Luteolibacter marinus]|nr:hypothetical protein [Luteolibacter marinus]
MKVRLFHIVLAAVAATAFSSCGAANSIYQTTDRAVQALGRTVTSQ